MLPVEPPPTPWAFPDPLQAPDDLVAMGADLEPGTLLTAYRSGMFPMPADSPRDPMLWFSPVRRGVLPLDPSTSSGSGLRVSHSLRKSCRRFEVRVDTAFDEVVSACGDPGRDGSWIDVHIKRAYGDLHRLGWAHSVETWRDGELVGGLYGVAIGGLFAGESMFHRATDASKVALVGLVERLRAGGGSLLDVQWRTDHLASLGVVEIAREDYLRLLRDAIAQPQLALG